jgi:hypothetical protein
VPLTKDAPKYGSVDVEATVLALLTPGGFVDSSAGLAAGSPLGVVVDTTSFYAESGGQVGAGGGGKRLLRCLGWGKWPPTPPYLELLVCRVVPVRA